MEILSELMEAGLLESWQVSTSEGKDGERNIQQLIIGLLPDGNGDIKTLTIDSLSTGLHLS